MNIDKQAFLEDTVDDAAELLDEAIKLIDNRLGDQYARKNPRMVSALVQSMAAIRSTNYEMFRDKWKRNDVAEAINDLSESVHGFGVAIRDVS